MLLPTEREFKKDPSKLEKVVYFTQIPIATIGLVETTLSVYYNVYIIDKHFDVSTYSWYVYLFYSVCVCGGGAFHIIYMYNVRLLYTAEHV